MDPCPRCGGPLDPSTAAYDDRGTLICRTCFSKQSAGAANALLTARDPTSTRNLYGGAIAAAFLGLMTCVTSALGTFFFLAAPLPILSGGATLRALFSDPSTKERLGAGYWLVIALSLTGIAFGFLGLLIGVLILGFVADRR